MQRETGFKDLRVLLAGKPNTVRVLHTVLSLAGVHAVVAAADAISAVHHLQGQHFDAVFCDEATGQVDGRPFVVVARRAAGMKNPAVLIYLTCHDVHRGDVEAARDLGFTDILVRPVTAATIIRKLQTALAQPREYVVAGNFSGPDRRGKRAASFAGQDRRTRPRKAKDAPPPGEDIVEL